MFWVYEEVRGQLFSLKPFEDKGEAIKYADTMFERAKTRGSISKFVVHSGHERVYTSGEQPPVIHLPTAPA